MYGNVVACTLEKETEVSKNWKLNTSKKFNIYVTWTQKVIHTLIETENEYSILETAEIAPDITSHFNPEGYVRDMLSYRYGVDEDNYEIEFTPDE